MGPADISLPPVSSSRASWGQVGRVVPVEQGEENGEGKELSMVLN